jgi:hypothetical protein
LAHLDKQVSGGGCLVLQHWLQPCKVGLHAGDQRLGFIQLANTVQQPLTGVLQLGPIRVTKAGGRYEMVQQLPELKLTL